MKQEIAVRLVGVDLVHLAVVQANHEAVAGIFPEELAPGRVDRPHGLLGVERVGRHVADDVAIVIDLLHEERVSLEVVHEDALSDRDRRAHLVDVGGEGLQAVVRLRQNDVVVDHESHGEDRGGDEHRRESPQKRNAARVDRVELGVLGEAPEGHHDGHQDRHGKRQGEDPAQGQREDLEHRPDLEVARGEQPQEVDEDAHHEEERDRRGRELGRDRRADGVRRSRILIAAPRPRRRASYPSPAATDKDARSAARHPGPAA
jgi:hypothetical protein